MRDSLPHAFGDRFDDPALAGAVSPLEDDDDFKPLGNHPLLQLDKFAV